MKGGTELSLGAGFEVEVCKYFHGLISDDLFKDKEGVRYIVIVRIVLHFI